MKFEQALAFQKEGRLTQAESVCRGILAHAPVHFDALHLLGIIEAQRSRPAAAAEIITRALQIDPGNAAAHCNLGNVLRNLGRREEVLACYDRALALESDFAEAHNNRGAVLQELGRPGEALASYEEALKADPHYAAAFCNRGTALQDLERHPEALESYDRAIALRPDYAKAFANRGAALQALKRHEEALASYDRALALQPDLAEALNNRGNVLRLKGELDDAVACYRKALSVTPDRAAVHDALIFTLLRLTSNGKTVRDQCTIFAEQFEERAPRLVHRNSRFPDRKVKVGYVSADFREHPVAYHIAPILENHDRRAVETYCYANHAERDDVTARLAPLADHWRWVANLSDEKLAELVQHDGIDILVDLSGHTVGNRLLVFARKPAPVQVTWIGLPATTGLAAMDYRFTDDCIDPAGKTEDCHSETLVRLSSHACFQPDAALPHVNDLPAPTNGYVTFGSFNEIDKVSPTTYALWSKLLAAVPDSRLMMVCDAWISGLIRQRFAARGIGPERLIFVERLPPAEYFRMHHAVDIALDPFPFNGGTVSRNALWMGVPVLTLTGTTAVSRVGAALMSQLGLKTFVAETDEGYVRAGSRWASDLDGLAEVRRTLRERVRRAPFSKAAEYTRELEAAYREMWRTWCAA